jgi:glutamine amidotransferase
MIAIIDFGMGNVGSIHNMLNRLGIESALTSDMKEIRAADKLILPGVGAFDVAMRRLQALGIIPLLNDLVFDAGIPLLGICLGMQLLSLSSDEGVERGLGWLDARTVRFDFEGSQLRVPHMGWNTVSVHKRGSILDELPSQAKFYFVHSYHVRCNSDEDVLATSTYGIEFHAAAQRGNVTGVQFHPEKSHRFGMQVLAKFAAPSKP